MGALDAGCGTNTSSYYDDNGHGTAVAGIIGAKDDGYGIAGVSPGVGIFSLRIGDANGAATYQAMVCAIDYAAATLSDGDPNNNIGVLNISFGGEVYEESWRDCTNTGNSLHIAICRATDKGITVAAAAMNSSQVYGNGYPASFPSVITATAFNDYNGLSGGGASPNCTASGVSGDDQYANYSNWGDSAEQAHTVAAPGTCVQTYWGNSNTPNSYFTGTSAAAPIVAGAAMNCKAWSLCPASGKAVVTKLVNDSQNYLNGNRGYGFYGDPFNLVNSRIYGPPVNLGLY